MDPWADNSTEAGPSWKAPTAREDTSSSAPPDSPVRLRADNPSADPWATDQAAEDGIRPPIEERRQPSAATPSGSQNDFDPWGGGSLALPPVSLAHADSVRDTQSEEQYGAAAGEGIAGRDDGWGGDVASVPDRSVGGLQTTLGHKPQDERDATEPPTGDDDDPWGSGARALQIKAAEDAEATARQMEILRLQEESKGTYEEPAKESEARSSAVDASSHDSAATKGSTKGASETAESVDATQAAAGSGGWRSFFARSSAKTSTPAEEEKDKAADNKSPTTASAAPRLWQAPTLGTHARTASSSSQPKIEQPSNKATSGPGWTMAPKPAQPASGGFMAGFLGGGQRPSAEAGHSKGNSLEEAKRSAQSKLDQIRQSLRPPETVSAADEDDEGDAGGTSLEFDSGEAFEAKKAAPAASDLLGDGDASAPQPSAVGRLFGRWRSGNKDETSSKDTTKPMSKDELSWLENVGASTSASEAKSGQGMNTAATEEEDWMAFVEGKPSDNATVKAAARYKDTTARPVGAYKDDMLSYDDGVGNSTTQRSATPVESSRYFYDEHASSDATPKRYKDDDFAAFKDSPTYDSVKTTGTSAFGSISSTRSIQRPASHSTPSPSLSPSNSISRATIHIPSPPRTSRPGSAAGTGGKLPPPPPASRHIVGNHVLHRTATPLQQGVVTSASATSSPQSTHSNLAIPAPSQVRLPAQQIATKTLSKGSTLTQDDLSFFENL